MISRISFILLCFLLAFLGINALVGGAMLAIRPGGEWLGMRRDWLLDSPFETYFFPGLLLFLFLGLFPLISLYGLLKRKNISYFKKFNLFPDKHWSWTFSLYSGLIAILWIIVQQIMTSYFWIQSPILILGWLVVVITLMPGIQARYKKN